jgi:hypothetical protein
LYRIEKNDFIIGLLIIVEGDGTELMHITFNLTFYEVLPGVIFSASGSCPDSRIISEKPPVIVWKQGCDGLH